MVFSLRQLIDVQPALPLTEMFSGGKNTVFEKYLPGFHCAKDRDLEDFLRNKAVDYERRNKSRTFLIMDIDKMQDENRAEIIAYFTLAIHSLQIPEQASKSLIKKAGRVRQYRQTYSGISYRTVG